MAGYKHLEIPGNFERFVKDKRQSANAYYRYFLARLSRMFEYKNLPDTIPHEILDRYLMNNGIACITEVEGKLYVFYGNCGGPQDVYYRPCEFIIANPHIKTSDGTLFSANIPLYSQYQPVDEIPFETMVGQPKGVLIRNDTEWQGLAPMIARYSFLLAENTLTLRTADVMLRIVALITAPTDKERIAAEEYLKSLENGNLKAIGESAFFDGIKLQSPPSNNGSYLTQFIEYQQYLKGSLYNEIGLSANYNMKREAIGKGESTLDEDALLPLVDNMLLCRKEDLAKVNELFGTNIEVSFSSAWLENEIESRSTLVNLVGSPQENYNPFGATPPMGGSGDSEAGSTQDDGSNDPDSGSTGAIGATGADEAQKETDDEENDGVGTVLPNDESSQDESSENSESSESKINDVGWSEELHELEEKVMEKADEPMGQPMIENMEGGTDGLVGKSDEETKDDAGDNPTD